MPAHRCIPAREGKRCPDRALPPGPSRNTRPLLPRASRGDRAPPVDTSVLRAPVGPTDLATDARGHVNRHTTADEQGVRRTCRDKRADGRGVVGAAIRRSQVRVLGWGRMHQTLRLTALRWCAVDTQLILPVSACPNVGGCCLTSVNRQTDRGCGVRYKECRLELCAVPWFEVTVEAQPASGRAGQRRLVAGVLLWRTPS